MYKIGSHEIALAFERNGLKWIDVACIVCIVSTFLLSYFVISAVRITAEIKLYSDSIRKRSKLDILTRLNVCRA